MHKSPKLLIKLIHYKSLSSQLPSSGQPPQKHHSSFLGISRRHLALNAALIHSPLDLEVSAITPAIIPRVDHQPVVHSILHSVAHNLDGVSAQRVSSLVLVHSRFIRREIRIHGKRGSHTSIIHQILHDRVHRPERVRLGRRVFILLERFWIILVAARILTSRGGILLGGTRGIRSIGGMVSTRSQTIWQASVTLSHVIIVTSRGTSLLLEPFPGCSRLPSI